jgi:proteasome accessory factor C
MVAAVPEVAGSGLVSGLLAKLSRGAADVPAEVVVATGAVDEVRSVVSRALRSGVALSFTYQAPDAAPTTRTVDPVQVLITNGQWYLQGWCHMREAMRTFHLDRLSDPQLTDIPSTHQGDNVPEPFIGGADDGDVAVSLPAHLLPLLSGFSPESETAGQNAIARVRFADPRGIKRLAGRFGGRMEVLSPAVARTATREWAAAGLALYHRPDGEVAG